jgi:beta-glucanase (GH16 family)
MSHRHLWKLLPVAVLTTALAQTAPSDSAWTLIWSDEFNGRAGTQPADQFWNYDVGNEDQHGWGNKELEYYTRSPDNVRLDGQGNLEIWARKNAADLWCWNGYACPYTSARLTTVAKVQFTYGKVEARIQTPPGQGYWPAFWALGTGKASWPSNGEIDIMERIGKTPNTVYGTLHGPGYSGSQGVSGQTELLAPVSGSFHTYTLIKRPGDLTWLLDGREYHHVTDRDIPAGKQWVFDAPFYLLLNLAVGGNWPGPPTASTVFPGVMKVDYVRVWEERGR